MTDAGFIAKTADLLHLLKYAQIQTASPADAVMANRLIQELRDELTLARRGNTFGGNGQQGLGLNTRAELSPAAEHRWGMSPMDIERERNAKR